MRYMIFFVLGLLLFTVKASAIAQDTDIKCEVMSFDFNLSGTEALSNLGSFSVSGKGGSGVVAKYYELPRTKLILSVFIIHYPKDPKDELTQHDQLSMSMILGKKAAQILYNDTDGEKSLKDAIGFVNTWYPIKVFDEGFEGRLSTVFLGKKKLVTITMQCKK